MKVIAYYPLHYGSDYLSYSIKSIYNYVEKIYILYTDTPSHGHGTSLRNPDNREKLKACITDDPQHKIVWTEGHWSGEGKQRDSIETLVPDADLIIAVDSDEIWTPEVITKAIEDAKNSDVKQHCIRMLTFWRSFNWVCTDEMQPVRIIAPKRKSGVKYLEGRVLHFGYSRSVESTSYKISCHGHHDEWRGDWINKFKNWPASGNDDLHPTCKDTWFAKPYDKTFLPDFMHNHPYFSLDVIP